MTSEEVKKGNNERQRKRRDKIKNGNQKNFLVRGVGGEFDERIRIVLAVKELVDAGVFDDEVVKLIARTAETVFDTKVIDRKFMNQEVIKYLTQSK